MNIAIVEDRDPDADRLTTFLNRYQEHHSLKLNISRYSSGEALLASPCEKYHLVFMDLYLEQTDGVETARRLTGRNAEALVIFLTTSREDIWRAVQMHACFDYIEKKALDYARLEETLDTARKKLRHQPKMLEFYSGKQKVRLPLSKIQYLVSHDKYTFFTLANGQETRYRVTFSSLCALLEEESRFLLCNRGILLNMDFIRQADRDVFVMTNGQSFPVRRRNHAEIMRRFHDHQFKKLNEEVY